MRSLALSGGLAGAMLCAPIASAANYTVGSGTDLITAISTANGSNDTSPNITLSGNITISGGTVVPTGTATSSDPVGNPPLVLIIAGTSTLTLSGAGTAWNAGNYAGSFGVTGSAGGGLTVSNGAQLQIPDTAASGFLSFNSGTLTVTGSGSSVTSHYMAVGRGGDATITVQNGGHMTTRVTSIGEGYDGSTSPTATLTAMVDGVGSRWDAGFLFVGTAPGGVGTSTASLTVSGGGIMTATEGGSIGHGGEGSALVTGAGSQLLVDGNLDIGTLTAVASGGGPGAGTLTITAGGLVSADSVTMADGAATSGTLAVDGTAGSRGTLLTGQLSKDVGTATVTFDGGILRSSASNTAFVSGFVAGDITILSGGMFIDTNGFTDTVSSPLAGAGALTKQGAGTLTLSGANSYTGTTEVAEGTLSAGATNTFSAASAHIVDSGATLDLNDFNQTVASMANTGAIYTHGLGITLTVTGAYVGNNGGLHLDTYLNNGATQLTDKLVAGSTAGTTLVYINNVGGPGGYTGHGATDGIQVVTVTGGAAASNGNFVLGHRVATGLFDYSLVKADNQNWYLQSNEVVDSNGNPIINPGTVSPEISTIASLNTLGLLTGQAQMDTLQLRLGEFHRADADTSKASDLWSRGYYHEDNLHTGDFGAAQVAISGTQIGGDRHFKDIFSRGDHVYLGAFAEYANAVGTPYVGKTTLDSYGAGLYATYYKQGWYADAVFKGDYNDYHAEVPDDPEMSTSGYGLAGSLEGGYQFTLGHGWAIEPQAQMTYQYEQINPLTDIFGRNYSFNNPQTLSGRLGVKVEKNFLFSGQQRITPYLRTSVVQDMLGDNRLTVTSVTLNTPYGGTSLMADGGITANVAKNIDIYASGILVSGTKQDSAGVSGGVRLSW